MPNYVVNKIQLKGETEDFEAVMTLLRGKTNEDAIDFNNIIPMPPSMNLVAGGYDTWYVAAYLQSLPAAERSTLKDKLLKTETYLGFDKSYYHKYEDAFIKPIPSNTLRSMQERFQADYQAIHPSSIEDVGKTYIDNILQYGSDTWYDWCCEHWGTKWGAMDSYIAETEFGYNTAWSAALSITHKLSELFPNVVFSHEWADEDIGNNCGRIQFQNGEEIEVYLPEGKEAGLFACGMWDYDPSDFGIETNGDKPKLDDLIASADNKAMDSNETQREAIVAIPITEWTK
ncbi:MAG: hypothetical protein IJZ42_01825 [Lachnospiraceae bacterium]|nr:hypothetical protein [Lachnospiraceae bacterium]